MRPKKVKVVDQGGGSWLVGGKLIVEKRGRVGKIFRLNPDGSQEWLTNGDVTIAQRMIAAGKGDPPNPAAAGGARTSRT